MGNDTDDEEEDEGEFSAGRYKPILKKILQGAIGAGDFEEASRLVSDIDVRDVAGEWIIIAAAHGLARNQSAAGRAIRRLEELQVDPEVFVTELPLEAGLASQLQKGLRAAKPS